MSTTYTIQATAKPEGLHWNSMRDAAEHLADLIDHMAATVRLSQNTASDEDLAMLDISINDPESAYEVADSLALEVNVARWEYSHATEQTACLARVQMTLGIGGPTVILDVDCSPADGAVQMVTLTRYWTEHDRAWSDDPRVQDIVGDFLTLIVAE